MVLFITLSNHLKYWRNILSSIYLFQQPKNRCVFIFYLQLSYDIKMTSFYLAPTRYQIFWITQRNNPSVIIYNRLQWRHFNYTCFAYHWPWSSNLYLTQVRSKVNEILKCQILSLLKRSYGFDEQVFFRKIREFIGNKFNNQFEIYREFPVW